MLNSYVVIQYSFNFLEVIGLRLLKLLLGENSFREALM